MKKLNSIKVGLLIVVNVIVLLYLVSPIGSYTELINSLVIIGLLIAVTLISLPIRENVGSKRSSNLKEIEKVHEWKAVKTKLPESIQESYSSLLAEGMSSIMHKEIVEKINTLIKTNLARKGYSFRNRKELSDFIIDNCTREVYPDGVEKYFALGEPFLEVKRNNNPNLTDLTNTNSMKLIAGSYRAL